MSGIKQWRVAVAAWLLCIIPVATAEPDAEKMLAQARLLTVLQQGDLKGELQAPNGSVPVALFLRKENLQFQFLRDGQWQVFHMRLAEQKAQLWSMEGERQVPLPEARLSEAIAESDLSYEDLALRFFYWPGAVLEGAEAVGMHDCWKLHVINPDRSGAYASVRVWLHQKYGAFMKIEGYNAAGQVIKRFEVDEVMKLKDDSWSLKQMSISRIDAATGRVRSQSKLIFESQRPLKVGGPR